MNDKTQKNGNGSDRNSRQFTLQRIYVKDCSFEAPNAPAIFAEQEVEPEIQLNLRNAHTALGNDTLEVVLHVSAHAKVGQRTLFLIELDQAGIFQIKGYQTEELKRLLGTYCPTTLFPYARETISSMVAKGGFPPLTLQPINFDALYAQASKETSDN
jgi:preprotein translocase subunit SecB